MSLLGMIIAYSDMYYCRQCGYRTRASCQL